MSERRQAAARPYRYLLGDATTEAARLRAQARLWDPTAHTLFDRVGPRPGWRVLEIGPGQGSLHLELRRRARGPIDAVEPSAVFRARQRRFCARDGFGDGRTWTSTLDAATLPRAWYDLIFARWVFLFLPDPAARIRQLAAALRPGGVLVIEDYLRETLRMVPAPTDWEAFLAADRAFFASQGGHASIASELPRLMTRAGLDVTGITPHVKTGHPGSPEWTWLSSYFFGVMDRLALFPPFSRSAATRLRREWTRAATRDASLLIAPTLVDIVGRRPRR